jgi:hypothetical protein
MHSQLLLRADLFWPDYKHSSILFYMKKAPAWPIIIFLIVIKLAFPFLLQDSIYELQRDEYLYYQQGQHLAFGFLENPPLISLLGTITAWLGGHEYLLKLWAVIFGALTLMLTCLLTAEFGGKGFAQFIAGLCIITGAYLRVHFLFQPNMLDIFFWTLSLYFLVRFLKTNSDQFLYLAALGLGIGWWGKNSILFLVAAIVFAFLITKQRKFFFERRIYLAAIIILLLVSPNIMWQYIHRWPLIHHMQELQETQLKYLDSTGFIKDQFLMMLPVIFIWIAGLIWLFRHKEYRVIAWTYVFVIIFLMAGSGKSYYSLGVYPVLFAAGAAAWEKICQQKLWLKFAIPGAIILLSIPMTPLLLALWKPQKLAAFYERNDFKKTGLLKWEDQQNHPLPQDFADMLGWKELAQKTESFFSSLPAGIKPGTGIYCRNYGQAGALQFYGKNKSFTSKVFSDNGSNLLWIPDSLHFNHLIVIAKNIPDADDEVFKHFKKKTVIDSVTNFYSRQLGDKIIFYQDADSLAAKIANEGLGQMKREYAR